MRLHQGIKQRTKPPYWLSFLYTKYVSLRQVETHHMLLVLNDRISFVKINIRREDATLHQNV